MAIFLSICDDVCLKVAVDRVWQPSCRHTSMCEHMTDGRNSHGVYQTVPEINRHFRSEGSVRPNVCVLSNRGSVGQKELTPAAANI